MKDGFLKAAALSPSLRVADCNYNASQIVSQLQDAAARGVRLAVFPEFCLTGYTCGDLFLQRTLQQGALDALQTVLDASRELDVVALVGLPLLVRGKLYNCAAVLCGGRLLGLVPKTYLPNYGEFYEKRQFTPGSTEVENVTVCGQEVPFGTSLLFRCRQMPSFVLGVEICEDLWSVLPPSTFHGWPVPPSLRTFRPAMRRSARPSTAGRWCRTSPPACSAATCTLLPATARAPRTWSSPATTSSPRTAPSSPRRLPSRAAGLRRSWTASGWSRSGRATPASSPALRGI